MKFYTSGDADKPVILLIPGTCCHWTIFNAVIPLLNEKFYTVAVSFDGFDETEHTVYPTMEWETVKIERYVTDHFGGRVAACYGSSLGGSYAAYLVQREKIHIDHAIIGSSDMDAAGPFAAALQANVMTGILYKMVGRGKIPGWMKRTIKKRKKKDPAMGREMERFMHDFTHSPLVGHLSRESVHNQYYWDLVTPIAQGIDVLGTTIHVFYAAGMGPKYEKRYRTYFAYPDIRRQNLNHETFFFCYPEAWAAEVADCCGMSSARQNNR